MGASWPLSASRPLRFKSTAITGLLTTAAPLAFPALDEEWADAARPTRHDSQRTHRAPTPCVPTHFWLSLHSLQSRVQGTAHTGRPLSVIRQTPLGRSGHAFAGGTVLSQEASSIVQPWALAGSDVHFLRRLLQWPEQHCGDWRQGSPGWRQATAKAGGQLVSQNPEANAAIDARSSPCRAAPVERDLARLSKRTGSIARRPLQATWAAVEAGC